MEFYCLLTFYTFSASRRLCVCLPKSVQHFGSNCCFFTKVPSFTTGGCLLLRFYRTLQIQVSPHMIRIQI